METELFNRYGIMDWSDPRIEVITHKIRTEIAPLIKEIADTLPPLEAQMLWHNIQEEIDVEGVFYIARRNIKQRKEERKDKK